MWKLLIILLLFFVPGVYALPMCAPEPWIALNCSMVTPVMGECSNYSFNVLNVTSGKNVTKGSMTPMAGSVFYFNLSVMEGDYLVVLCDGTTKEYRIKGSDSGMALGAFVLLPMILGLIMVFVAQQIAEDRIVLRSFMVFSSVGSFLLSLYFASAALRVAYGTDSELARALGVGAFVVGLLLLAFVAVIFIYIIQDYVRIVKARKGGDD